MIVGRTGNAIKIKTGGTTRAVNCACCSTCPPVSCGAVKITNANLIALLNSATSGSFNYSQGSDSSPLWTSTGPDSFAAEWSCCLNLPIECENCFNDDKGQPCGCGIWEYGCSVIWDGGCNALHVSAFDFPWFYQITPGGGECSNCDPTEESYMTINGYSFKMGMLYGCEMGFPIYPISITLT